MSAWTCRPIDGKAAAKIVPPRLRLPWWKGLGADSEEKHEPASDIDTAVVDGLKVLDPDRPIREADIFLTYCTNTMAAKKQNPGQQIIALPENLSDGAAYGLTVIDTAPPAAQCFANFIVSPDGEAILAGYGFAPGN